jgi:hypothetical protein
MPRLLFVSDGDVWIFWAGGVSRIEAGEPALVTELFATHQTVDAGGNLWIVSGSEDEQVLWWAVDDG